MNLFEARRAKLTILQVNLGDLCNQSCSHCHVGASPLGRKIMSRPVVERVIAFLKKNKGLTLDVTGGAPELNPHFDVFIGTARPLVDQLIVRSNLTVFFERGGARLYSLFRGNRVHVICSLPCYTRQNVDAQRGPGVFDKSIKALRELNRLGYGKEDGLVLDIAYNPMGDYLPSDTKSLQEDYKRHLETEHGVVFNRLITLANAPINRFKGLLEERGALDKYLEALKDSFNFRTLDNIMCRTLLSVGYDGKVYDCDFNQALGWALADNKGGSLDIGSVIIEEMTGREITCGAHCLACTAGCGSSCHGALV